MSFRNNRYSFLMRFAVLAFLVRSFIPVGFMPGEGKPGLAPLVICTGTGTATIYVSADKVPDQKPAHPAHDGGVCSFAAAFAWGAVPAAVAPEWPPLEAANADVPAVAAHLAGIAIKPYFSQGPPVLL